MNNNFEKKNPSWKNLFCLAYVIPRVPMGSLKKSSAKLVQPFGQLYSYTMHINEMFAASKGWIRFVKIYPNYIVESQVFILFIGETAF